MSTFSSLDDRIESLAIAGRRDRAQGLRELEKGFKRGHWIWFVFPTLVTRGGDMFSAMQVNGLGADLRDEVEATAYASHAELRTGLLDSFKALEAAMSKHEKEAPWKVLDSSSFRKADGEWIRGPVDSFKARISATLFAVVAHRIGDEELRSAAVNVLHHFTGDVVYTAAGQGTSGHSNDLQRNVLKGPDEETLRILGEKNWEEVANGRAKKEL